MVLCGDVGRLSAGDGERSRVWGVPRNCVAARFVRETFSRGAPLARGWVQGWDGVVAQGWGVRCENEGLLKRFTSGLLEWAHALEDVQYVYRRHGDVLYAALLCRLEMA